jgi:hypothetical protein
MMRSPKLRGELACRNGRQQGSPLERFHGRSKRTGKSPIPWLGSLEERHGKILLARGGSETAIRWSRPDSRWVHDATSAEAYHAKFTSQTARQPPKTAWNLEARRRAPRQAPSFQIPQNVSLD